MEVWQHGLLDPGQLTVLVGRRRRAPLRQSLKSSPVKRRSDSQSLKDSLLDKVVPVFTFGAYLSQRIDNEDATDGQVGVLYIVSSICGLSDH